MQLNCSERNSSFAPPPPQQLPPFPARADPNPSPNPKPSSARLSEHKEYDEEWNQVQPSNPNPDHVPNQAPTRTSDRPLLPPHQVSSPEPSPSPNPNT